MTQEIYDEFRAEFWKSAGVITFTQVAMEQFANRVPMTPVPENPDPQLFLGAGDPNEGGPVDASWRMSDLEGAAQPDGWLQQWLTDAWIALIFARWEKHYRPAFAHAGGVAEDKVACDVIGDVRHLRNDVVHHGGIASARNTGRCKILVRFNPGDRVVLTPGDLRHLLANLSVAVDQS